MTESIVRLDKNNLVSTGKRVCSVIFVQAAVGCIALTLGAANVDNDEVDGYRVLSMMTIEFNNYLARSTKANHNNRQS